MFYVKCDMEHMHVQIQPVNACMMRSEFSSWTKHIGIITHDSLGKLANMHQPDETLGQWKHTCIWRVEALPPLSQLLQQAVVGVAVGC